MNTTGTAILRTGDALNATGRPIVFYSCVQGQEDVFQWGPSTANLWRTTGWIHEHVFFRSCTLCSVHKACGSIEPSSKLRLECKTRLADERKAIFLPPSSVYTERPPGKLHHCSVDQKKLRWNDKSIITEVWFSPLFRCTCLLLSLTCFSVSRGHLLSRTCNMGRCVRNVWQ